MWVEAQPPPDTKGQSYTLFVLVRNPLESVHSSVSLTAPPLHLSLSSLLSLTPSVSLLSHLFPSTDIRGRAGNGFITKGRRDEEREALKREKGDACAGRERYTGKSGTKK